VKLNIIFLVLLTANVRTISWSVCVL